MSNRFSPHVPQEQANRAATRITADPMVAGAPPEEVLAAYVGMDERERDGES